MLLDLLKFALVGLLGFMPLVVIHWSDRRPKLQMMRVNAPVTSVAMFKASIMVVLSDWASHFPVV